jgi:hypothetical protein
VAAAAAVVVVEVVAVVVVVVVVVVVKLVVVVVVVVVVEVAVVVAAVDVVEVVVVVVLLLLFAMIGSMTVLFMMHDATLVSQRCMVVHNVRDASEHTEAPALFLSWSRHDVLLMNANVKRRSPKTIQVSRSLAPSACGAHCSTQC